MRRIATQTALPARQNAEDGAGVLPDGVKQQNALAVPAGRISTREVAAIIGGDNPQELALENGAPAQVRKLPDSGKRRLRINDLGLGAYLSESSWAFLDLLAESRPRHFGRATAGDGALPYACVVGGTIRACHARRELQRQLPQGVKAKWFVQVIRGKGNRLRADVRIRRRGEARLQFHDGQRLALLYQHEGERKQERKNVVKSLLTVAVNRRCQPLCGEP